MPFTRMFSGITSVRELIGRAECALTLGNIDIALGLVHDFVERIVTEPICAAQVFASRELDQLCMRIGQRNFAALRTVEATPASNRSSRPIAVYLASRLQRSGGHSRLIQDFIQAQPDLDHLILSTEVGGPSDRTFFRQLFADTKHVSCNYAPKGDFEARLQWAQSILLATQPAHVYLFNHHQDCVAVATCVPELNLAGSFCHHGDHHLCLGVHLTHLDHIDFHPMGFHHCRDELGINNRYVPLTFEDKGGLNLRPNAERSERLTTATAARSNKVEIPYYVSYLDTIPRLLSTTGGIHVHIGRLTPWARRRIYKNMLKEGVARDRFVYVEWTPSVWKTLQTYDVDVYIASFPYGAGLTLIEAMGAGIPVIMHRHMFSRVLSGLELAYSEAFSWTHQDELLLYLKNIELKQLHAEKQVARSQYERFHHPGLLHAHLKRSNTIEIPPPPLNNEFNPRLDEWASWAERQMNFSQLLYRLAYRLLRIFRRWYL